MRNEKIIENILLENYDKYYRLAYSYVHNDADACDIVQNGAYRAIRSSQSLRQKEFAATWVYRIMLNEIFRFCRKKESNLVFLDEITASETENNVPSSEDNYRDIDLQRALDALPPKDKAIVELRFFEDLKIEDIAKILNENVNTVKSRLYRSMEKLRLQLKDDFI